MQVCACTGFSFAYGSSCVNAMDKECSQGSPDSTTCSAFTAVQKDSKDLSNAKTLAAYLNSNCYNGVPPPQQYGNDNLCACVAKPGQAECNRAVVRGRPPAGILHLLPHYCAPLLPN